MIRITTTSVTLKALSTSQAQPVDTAVSSSATPPTPSPPRSSRAGSVCLCRRTRHWKGSSKSCSKALFRRIGWNLFRVSLGADRVGSSIILRNEKSYASIEPAATDSYSMSNQPPFHFVIQRFRYHLRSGLHTFTGRRRTGMIANQQTVDHLKSRLE